MDIKSAFDKMFNLPNFPRVRTTDPLTSFEAAEAIKPAASKHYLIILDCLRTHGALGKDGIASLTKLESNQVARPKITTHMASVCNPICQCLWE